MVDDEIHPPLFESPFWSEATPKKKPTNLQNTNEKLFGFHDQWSHTF